MFTKLKFLLSLLFIVAISYSNLYSQATTGKIQGRVFDAGDNSPLIGATIRVENTNLGAITDESGNYTILNIPVGDFTVTASYIGYQPISEPDVKVSVGITTTLNFGLREEGFITAEIEIVGKRNAIAPDQSGKIIEREFIDNTGIRGIENIASKTAGVVQDERGNNINIRGGRTNETAVIIDGVLTTNPLDGTSTAFVSNNALQEMAVLTGGFSAEYGNVLSGIINVTTRRGTDRYSGTLEAISDVIAGDWINTDRQGYNVYSVSIGGPLIPSTELSRFINFFGSVERQFNLVNNPSWIAKDLGLPNNILPNYKLFRWGINGKLNFDLMEVNKNLPLQLFLGTNISRTDREGFIQSYMLFNSNRNPWIEEYTDQYYARINHQLSSKLFYNLQVNYFNNTYAEQDREFRDDFFAYGDPNRVQGLTTPGTARGFDRYALFAQSNRVRSYYEKNKTEYIGGNFNMTGQFGNNELKIGGEYKYHTIRFYNVRPVQLYNFRNASPEQLKSVIEGAIGLSEHYGYDYLGNEIDGTDFNKAKNPIVGAIYLQDKLEFPDFTLNAGLRFDYLDANSWRVKNLSNVVGSGGDPTQLDDADFDMESDPVSALSPRLGFSFPVTNNTIFHAQYGKFIQLPNLELLYVGKSYFDYYLVNAGFATIIGNPNLKPEKTTSYEMGVKQFVGDRISVGLTAYYKETEDLIGIAQYPQLPNSITVYENRDYGTIRGFDLSFDMRRTNRLALTIAYGLSYASGTGSTADAGFIASWLGVRQPKVTFPLNYDQRHTGVFNVDYRFGKTDVPKGFLGDVLSQLGVNLLYQFNSGRPFTLKSNSVDITTSTGRGAELLSSINSAHGPWNNRLDLKVDKTFSFLNRLDFNLYLYVINVLNTELVNNVWESSGLPGTTGFLNSNAGQSTIQAYNNPEQGTTSEEYVKRYNLITRAIGNYGPPRQIRLGVKLNF
jgi:outer membrane receptor protein involved in Fe transport